MSGRLFLVGTLSGNVDEFDLRGRAEGDSIIARGNTVQRVVSSYAWRGGRATPSVFAFAADADRVSALGFAFDTATARLTYAAPGPEDDGGHGHVELSVIQRDTADRRVYEAKGDYSLHPDRRVLRIAELSLQFDSALWAMPHADTVTWGKAGVQFANFELRNRSGRGAGGRIRVRGEITARGSDGELAIDVDSLPVTDVVNLLQSDVVATGEFSLHGTVRGTMSSPTFSSRFELTDAEFNATPFPGVRGRATYADQRLVAHADAFHGTGEPLMTLDARLPLNLAFTDVKGDRMLNEPMSIDVVGDSLPIDLIPDVTSLVSDVHGRAAGKLAVRGTIEHPTLSGLVTVDHATTTIVYTGATVEQHHGIDSHGRRQRLHRLARRQRGRACAASGIARLRQVERAVVRPRAEVRRGAPGQQRRGDLRVDTDLTLKGPFKGATVGGDITIARGVVRAPEGSQQTLVGPGDPGLFNVDRHDERVGAPAFSSAIAACWSISRSTSRRASIPTRGCAIAPRTSRSTR